MNTTLNRLILAGLAVVLIFSPWSSISCAGAEIVTQSGLQHAIGDATINLDTDELERMGGEREDPPNDYLALLYILGALAALVLAFRAHKSGDDGICKGAMASHGAMALSLLLILVIGTATERDFNKQREGEKPDAISWNVEWGFWLALLATAGLIAADVEKRKSKASQPD